MKTIIGSGIAGMLAALTFRKATILERSAEPSIHRAVLRFRSDTVSQYTGIPFKKVKVRKGIWMEKEFVLPSIQTSNLYSKKVLGVIEPDRSINNLNTEERYVAPEDFIEQLYERVKDRVQLNYEVNTLDGLGAVCNTAPLNIMAKLVKEQPPEDFNYAPITVDRYRIKNCDAYQTIYYPDPEINAYRASITGDMLIVEKSPDGYNDLGQILKSFGLADSDVTELKLNHVQRYGKIQPLKNNAWRLAFLGSLTMKHNVFSLGRFATWRNILLDDLVKDIEFIKSNQGADAYNILRAMSK
jgi:hypothetical protein